MASGVRLLASDRDVQAVAVPDSASEAFLARMAALDLDVRELQTIIETPGGRLAPRSEVPPLAEPGAGLFLLQYVAPPLPDWQRAVNTAGLIEIFALPERSVVVAGTREQVAQLREKSWIEYAGPYLPEYKFRPTGEDRGEFTIQIARTAATIPAIASIEARVGGFYGVSSRDNLFTARFKASREMASSLVDERFVVGVETFVPTQASDERQALSLTGKIDVEAAKNFANAKSQLGTGSNYRRWLDFYGFTKFALTQSADVVVDVADSGVSMGCSADSSSLQAHRDLRGRIVYHNGATTGPGTEAGQEQDPDYSDKYGHGTVVAGMVAGNPEDGIDTANQGTTGLGLTDSGGYYWGMGVAPGVRIGNTVILDASGNERGPATARIKDWTARAVSRPCNTPQAPCTSTGVVCPATVQTHSHNEYEDTGTHAGQYTTSAQDFDSSVRRADWAAGPPLAITVSAGNIRQRPNDFTTMVLSPATAKNVISVGATESDRDPWASCEADGSIEAVKRHTAQDYTVLAYASRRGTVDSRIKPDIVAPGTLSVGTRSYRSGTYCLNTPSMGTYSDGKPYYHGASGTSFAAPVAAGSVALLKHYYKRSPSPFGSTFTSLLPSPAMYKAMLVAGARSLLGGIDRYSGASMTTWPHGPQGFGAISLEPLLDATILHGWRDQQATPLLQNQSQYFTVTVGDPSKPLRIVLAWTDAPGTPDASAPYIKALMNDLDLRATWSDGLQYYGNVMNASGYSYVPGCGRPLCPSPADVLNNVEVINIDPARLSDPANRTFTVRVWAAVLTAVGVPGVSFGANNQDYALYVLNGSLTQNP